MLELIVPGPLAMEYVYGDTPPAAVKVCEPVDAIVAVAGEIAKAALIVTAAFAVATGPAVHPHFGAAAAAQSIRPPRTSRARP